MRGYSIITIGASAGGIPALKSLLGALPGDLDAAVFIVQHMAPDAPSVLDQILARSTSLRVRFARDRDAIEHGTVYIAPPDHHLLVKEREVRLLRGPRENRARPAIDPLFRSAAVAHPGFVIGVVLSGFLDDGAAGMVAIKQCGGVALVQHPEEALESEMPEWALEALEGAVDAVAPVADLAGHIARLVGSVAARPAVAPRAVTAEVRMLEALDNGLGLGNEVGTLVPVSRPECGGPLSEIDDPCVRRYRCHTGHAFTATALLAEQAAHVERALWAAVRSLKERSHTFRVLAADSHAAGRLKSRDQYESESDESRLHARILRDILYEHGESARPRVAGDDG